MTAYGIEKLRVHPTSLCLDFADLAEARGFDASYAHRELMVEARGLNPVWEDTVTMAVNAARPLLSEADRASIGLLVVATETSLDQEKAVSSWVLHHLGLPSTCRHFELKSACYSGSAALKLALAWLSSGMARKGEKALVITSDESLSALHKPWEYVLGAGAVALLVSDQPDFLEVELEKSGVHSHEVTDVIRPLPWLETGNSELSLFSYMEALGGAFESYVDAVGPFDPRDFFHYQVYHVPFGGISVRAHKVLMNLATDASKEAIRADWERRVRPSLAYARRIGATYGGSVFLALLGLAGTAEALAPGDRIGIYSYGSGSCAEFYSGIAGARMQDVAREAGLDALLDRRMPVSVETYERLEQEREAGRQSPTFTPDFDAVPGLFERYYRGQGLLTFTGSSDWTRTYAFS